MKDSKWIVAILILGFAGIATQNALLMKELVFLQNRMEESQIEYEDHLEDVYFLMKSDSSRLYTIMDTEVRILHYAKPHKHPMWACPECAEQKQRGDKDDVQSSSKYVESKKEVGSERG